MKIVSADFVLSSFSRLHWVKDRRPEIAFLGRSNVGKSSLINSLLMRKGLARTSNTPGRTQSINFFLINDSFYFADLPGYGYAKVSKSMRSDWGVMAEEYLRDRQELALCVQLIDSRHKPTELDVQLNDWLVHHNKTHIVVATKVDKLSRNELRKAMNEAEKALPDVKILQYSARTGSGRDALWDHISGAINNFQING